MTHAQATLTARAQTSAAAPSPILPSLSARAARAEAVHAELSPLLGTRLSTNAAIREQHGRGEGLSDLHPPELVAFPESTGEVAMIVRACNAHAMPIIPFGVGTSLEGHVCAPFGGLSLDLSRMDKVLEINAESLDCKVQAGVTRIGLNAELKSLGLFFPLDPGANATLGGMAATRASGTNAVRYGTMREVTLGLTVVTPSGEIIHTGGRARKSSAGYDLTRIYVGSEGTLGVITELQVRVFGVPETISSAICQFPDVDSAVRTVMLALQIGIPMARIELVDHLAMKGAAIYSKLTDLAPLPTLFLEFHGGPAAVAEQIATLREIADDFGGSAFRFAEREEERTRLWKARHDAYYSGRTLAPGCESIVSDACVPISELADCLAACYAAAETSGLICPVVGHVGDGNFHMMAMFDPNDPAARARAETLMQQVSMIAQNHGGTCTGEHGVGMHKLDAMRREHGEALSVMWAIKHALDPKGLMNPGKTLPTL
ncbi:FAD-binding oxidoreductase [Novosphingobium sp. FKTRR1]|uniref:FAD-binding oxidoreductase n=1 Tax=Novosphingobium sp. FKTRR1 TaxID=2879118 RepID=UPI001CF0C92F|nr:FAD-linked oxidase C-terminal domain-containing protein [Novosphingobium sp. FKTRR1]